MDLQLCRNCVWKSEIRFLCVLHLLLFEKLLLKDSKIRQDEGNSRVSKFCIRAQKKQQFFELFQYFEI
jgi:hypothetical protein